MTALDEWLALSLPMGSHWRRRARHAMRSVVSKYEGIATLANLLPLIDDAYPFGQRSHAPYKAWLAERKLFIQLLDAPPAPTAEDRAACEVAIDLLELGRIAEAQSLLDAQAPRRLNRDCPACGAAIGKLCRERRDCAWVELAVPHLSRVELGRPLLSRERRGA
jgi:hypothetical protein